MALPTNADVIVVHGYWLDELTGLGVKQANGLPATIMFDPVPLLGANATKTPNLRDLTSNAHLKTRTRVATVDPVTGYYAAQLVASNDPDLDAYSGRKVTFLGEDPFTIEVPYNASTVTVSAEMAAKTGLTQGSSVKAIWLPNASVTTIPTPTPSINYLSSSQTLANIAAGIETHDEDPDAHADIRALIGTPYTDEQAQDTFAALIAAGAHSGISFSYNDAGNALSATVTGGGAQALTVRSVSTNTTAVAGELLKVDASGGAKTVTPPSSPATGAEVIVMKTDASANAVVWSGTVDGDSQGAQLVAQWAAASYVYDGTQWLVRSTNLGAAAVQLLTATTTTKTANYTAASGELVPVDTTGGAVTVTSPSGGPFAVRWKAGTTGPTVSAAGGFTINGAASATLSLPPSTSSGELVVFQCFGADYQQVAGFKPQGALNAANDGRYAPLNPPVRSVSTNTTAVAGEFLKVDASAGARTVTPPGSPTTGTQVVLAKVDSTSNAVIWSATVDGDSQGAQLTGQWTAVTFLYDGTQWLLRSTNLTSATSGSGGASDATTSSKGIVQLAGDLGGTAASPTVPGLTSKAATSYVDALNNVLPAGHGYITWSMDPAMATSNSAPTAGVVTLIRVRVGAATSVSNTVVWQAVAGASVTNAYFGLYDSSGTQLGVSTDQSSNLVGTGARTVALSGAPLSLAAGYYYVAVLIGAATTVPQFSRSASSGIVNVGLAAPSLRFATSGTGLTALPSTITMSSTTGVSIGYWAALS